MVWLIMKDIVGSFHARESMVAAGSQNANRRIEYDPVNRRFVKFEKNAKVESEVEAADERLRNFLSPEQKQLIRELAPTDSKGNPLCPAKEVITKMIEVGMKREVFTLKTTLEGVCVFPSDKLSW